VNGRVLWLSILSAAASLTLVLVLLRIDPVVPGSGLSVADPEKSPPTLEQPTAVPETPLYAAEETPLTAVEETPRTSDKEVPKAVIDKEPLLALQEDAAVAVKNQEPEIMLETLAELGESSPQIIPETIEPRPLRIAGQLSSNAELATGSSDRIEPLQLPQVSPNLSSLSVAQLTELDRKKLISDFAREHDISVMSVANAGINGINKLTGSDISLLASRDENGEVSGFRLKSKRFSFSRPLAREQ